MSSPISRVLLFGVVVGSILAQTTSTPDNWQNAAGGKRAFDIASVKKQPPDSFHPPNFPLDPGDSYAVTGGRFYADFPVTAYIVFAYKMMLTDRQRQAMLAGLPKWVETDVFEIEAKAGGNPTKDQMRLMVQSLLADRFHLKMHFESREMPVYALTLIKPGRLGPMLHPRNPGQPCETLASDVFPNRCYILSMWPRGETQLAGARDVPMSYLAQGLPTMDRSLDRPVVDRTGLKGNFDFTLEYAPERSGPPPAVIRKGGGSAPAVPPSSIRPPLEGDKPPLAEAVREQLGLKLESSRGRVPAPVIDHIESPSEN